MAALSCADPDAFVRDLNAVLAPDRSVGRLYLRDVSK